MLATAVVALALETAISLPHVTTGVTTTDDGRIFLVEIADDGRPHITEWHGNATTDYPDAQWNRENLVHANSLRIGPEGDLWVVDAGAPGLGQARVPGGPKLVRIDPEDNRVRRTYALDAVTTDRSYVDDVRFHDNTAYLTDAGEPALIVLDLESGSGRRVLENDVTTRAPRPMTADGQELRGLDNQPVYVHADQLEISPDGRWLYFQPATGPLSRIETKWLDDESLPDSERATRVENIATTPSTGGTAIDSDGVLYVSDVDQRRILRITPDGRVSTLIQDPRLAWVDAMWIDVAGNLWLPAAQLNLTAPFQGGVSRVQPPIEIYKLPLEIAPVR